MSKPIAIDLCCGLGGWAEGLLAEGYEVIGYDTEAHDYGTGGYPGMLILQDITTLHGSQFKDVALFVASPPCQNYSYMAMPWSRGKAKAAAIEADDTGEMRRELNLLFNTCFRIQREACEAAGRYIPMIVENVRGAQKWVGPAKWNYGSFYLWGDVPALMPMTLQVKAPGKNWNEWKGWDGTEENKPSSVRPWGDKKCSCPISCDCENPEPDDPNAVAHCSEECPIHNYNPRPSLTCPVHGDPQVGTKVPSMVGRRTDVGKGARFTTRDCGAERIEEGVKQGGDWFNATCPDSVSRLYGSKSPQRKAASAMIAKIPFPLSQHIAKTFYPRSES